MIPSRRRCSGKQAANFLKHTAGQEFRAGNIIRFRSRLSSKGFLADGCLQNRGSPVCCCCVAPKTTPGDGRWSCRRLEFMWLPTLRTHRKHPSFGVRFKIRYAYFIFESFFSFFERFSCFSPGRRKAWGVTSTATERTPKELCKLLLSCIVVSVAQTPNIWRDTNALNFIIFGRLAKAWHYEFPDSTPETLPDDWKFVEHKGDNWYYWGIISHFGKCKLIVPERDGIAWSDMKPDFNNLELKKGWIGKLLLLLA